MAKNKISDLRNHLFETLEALKDEENPMQIDRALAISQVAQTIIDSAKVEVKALEVLDFCEPSEFFEIESFEEKDRRRVEAPKQPLLTVPGRIDR